MGAYRLQLIGEEASFYGTTGAVQVGAGLDAAMPRLRPFIELRGVVHLTDYAAADFTPTTVVPLGLGVRF